MLLYYITDRTQFPGPESVRRKCILEKVAHAARCGIDYIQLREKDLGAGELENLAAEAVQIVREESRVGQNRERRTRLLINSRADIALAVGADGVHLRCDDISPREARNLWSSRDGSSAPQLPDIYPTIVASCHSDVEVARAAAEGADLAVFAPVFEKQSLPPVSGRGLESLRQACRYNIPVLALGGIALDNIAACLNQGAAGVAAIRLFQENDIGEIVHRLGVRGP